MGSDSSKPSRLDRLGTRWPWFGRLLAIHYRFVELQGGYAASAIALSVFVSLFPLLLVIISVVGWRTGVDADLTGRIVNQLGLTGQAAETLSTTLQTASGSAKAGSIIGLVGLTWSGLGVVGALQHVVNLPWQAPDRRGLGSRLVGIPWLVGAALGVIASVAVTSVLAWLPGWTAPLALVVGFALDVGLFLWTFWLLGNVEVGWRALMPGAIVAAMGAEILKVVGTVIVPRMVESSSAVYGSLGLVFGLLAWLVMFGRVLVYASVVNVVRFERERGTITLVIDAPNVADARAVGATRAGIIESADVSGAAGADDA